MATRICLVRHGETAWNAERRLQGHTDIPLNDTGLVQARATAASLAAERFDAAYSSDLTRARQTAAAIAERCGLELAFDAALRERHYGSFQALTYDEARARFPDDYHRFETRDPEFTFPEGGESLRQFAARIHGTLEGIARRHPDGTVLIVTHGGVLDMLWRTVHGCSLHGPRDCAIPNTGINRLHWRSGTLAIDCWGDDAHLAGLPEQPATAQPQRR